LLQPLASWRSFLLLLVAWGLPIALASAAYVVLAYPAVERVPAVAAVVHRVDDLGLSGVWMFGLFCLAASLVAWFNERLAYEVLEGYHWPSWLAERRRDLHRRHRDHLLQWDRLRRAEGRIAALPGWSGPVTKQRVSETTESRDPVYAKARDYYLRVHLDWEAVEAEAPKAWWPLRLVRDRPVGLLGGARLYPAGPHDTMPTKLGNRIRAMETYGESRWGFDAVRWYFQMAAATGPRLTENEQEARLGVDVYVGSTVVAWVMSAVVAGTAVLAQLSPDGGSPLAPALLALAGWLLGVAAYRRAVTQVNEWANAFRALVDAARLPMATMLGLDLPPTGDRERHMWQVATRLGEYAGLPPEDVGLRPKDPDLYRAPTPRPVGDAVWYLAEVLKDDDEARGR
jgi:hypothetical protein